RLLTEFNGKFSGQVSHLGEPSRGIRSGSLRPLDRLELHAGRLGRPDELRLESGRYRSLAQRLQAMPPNSLLSGLAVQAPNCPDYFGPPIVHPDKDPAVFTVALGA